MRSMFDARSDADKRLRSPDTTRSSPLFGERRVARVDRRGHQADDVLAQLLEFVGEQRANGVERLSGILPIEEIRSLEQLRLRIGPVGVKDAILHVAFGRNDDQQHPPIRQTQKFHVPERGLAPPRGRDDAGEMREVR